MEGYSEKHIQIREQELKLRRKMGVGKMQREVKKTVHVTMRTTAMQNTAVATSREDHVHTYN
jgi:hypothetical protein